MTQTFKCRKCDAELTQQKARWCPHCGIARPVDGKAKIASLIFELNESCHITEMSELYLHCEAGGVFIAVFFGMPFLLHHHLVDKFLPTVLVSSCSAVFAWMATYRVSVTVRDITISARRQSIWKKIAEFEMIDPSFLPKDSLLRASTTPTSPDMLLRAAQPTPATTTSSQELLRAGIDGDAAAENRD